MIDTSFGTDFTEAWYLCSGLTFFPTIDTALGTTFISTFNGCSSLICIGAVNTTSATDVTGMFTNTPLLVNPNTAEQTLLTTIGGSPNGYNYINVNPCPITFRATITPLDFVSTNTIYCNSDFAVDWGDGIYIGYPAGDASVVAS